VTITEVVASRSEESELLRTCVLRALYAALIFWSATLFSYLWFDTTAEKWVHAQHGRVIAGYFGRVGSWTTLLPLIIVAGLWLIWKTRSLIPTAFLVACYVLAAVATSIVKTSLARAEPLDIAGELGRSFPSGHTAQASAVYFAFAFIAAMLVWKIRRVMLVAAVVLSLTSGICLYVRDAHWLSDLFAGYAIGFTAIIVSSVLWLPPVRDNVDRIFGSYKSA
jgi:membrane-associated phospholipid phosphatase